MGWFHERSAKGYPNGSSRLVSTLLCTLIHLLSETTVPEHEEEWVVSELAQDIPQEFSDFARICQKYILTNEIYLYDLLEIFSVEKISKKRRLEQIERIVQRASKVGISIQLSLQSTPEEIENYDRLFGSFSPKEGQEQPSNEVKIQNSTVKSQEMLFISSWLLY